MTPPQFSQSNEEPGGASAATSAEEVSQAQQPGLGHGEEGRFTIIGLQGWHFAIPLERSAGTIEAVNLTRVPMAPEAVLGLTHLQGRILTVLDLGHLLGLATAHQPRHFFLVNDEEEQVGLVVDTVEDIVLVEPLSLDAIEMELPPGVRANASGFFRWRDHPVVNLSVERLLK